MPIVLARYRPTSPTSVSNKYVRTCPARHAAKYRRNTSSYRSTRARRFERPRSSPSVQPLQKCGLPSSSPCSCTSPTEFSCVNLTLRAMTFSIFSLIRPSSRTLRKRSGCRSNWMTWNCVQAESMTDYCLRRRARVYCCKNSTTWASPPTVDARIKLASVATIWSSTCVPKIILVFPCNI